MYLPDFTSHNMNNIVWDNMNICGNRYIVMYFYQLRLYRDFSALIKALISQPSKHIMLFQIFQSGF